MNALKKDTSKKTKKPEIFLSVIIPCHNCRNSIGNLLDSLIQQVRPPRFEVIIQDDNSTDGFMEIVNGYKLYLDIKYFKNKPREIHCPGNTRNDGLDNAKGKWVTFIDHDDAFELNAFNEFVKCRDHNDEQIIVTSDFRDYYPDQKIYGREYKDDAITWLHGKFYNRKYLVDNNIRFRENMMSNEDLYFNQCIFAHLTAENKNYSILRQFTYIWTYNDNSLSRRMFKEKEFYIDKYFDEYVEAAVQPWLDMIPKYPNIKDKAFARCCYILLYAYFYYQSLYMRNGYKHVKKNRDIFEEFLNNVRNIFNVTNKDILNIIYNDDETYNRIRSDSFGGCLRLIETESFKDFIDHF